jgi:hypothetical protein
MENSAAKQAMTTIAMKNLFIMSIVLGRVFVNRDMTQLVKGFDGGGRVSKPRLPRNSSDPGGSIRSLPFPLTAPPPWAHLYPPYPNVTIGEGVIPYCILDAKKSLIDDRSTV